MKVKHRDSSSSSSSHCKDNNNRQKRNTQYPNAKESIILSFSQGTINNISYYCIHDARNAVTLNISPRQREKNCLEWLNDE